MRAMILAAGLGTRLRPITNLMPKPMAPVLNVPVMEHIALLLAKHAFAEVIANLSYRPEAIREHFGDGSGVGIELSYSDEPEPLGTAGGVGKAREFLAQSDSFLVISGDALTDVDLTAMREAHEANAAAGAIATLATKRVKDTSEFGVVITGEDGRVQGFQEKPDPAEALSDLANCGIYMFRREIFDYFPDPGLRSPAGDPDQPEGFVDWALDVFPALLEGDVAFHAHEIEAYWNDIGSVSELVQGNADALRGLVSLRRSGEEPEEGVLVGVGCEIGDGVDLRAPVVIGPGSRIGAGARVRDAVVLAGAELPPGAIVFGGVFGTEAS